LRGKKILLELTTKPVLKQKISQTKENLNRNYISVLTQKTVYSDGNRKNIQERVISVAPGKCLELCRQTEVVWKGHL
jgi:phage terminase small subunit